MIFSAEAMADIAAHRAYWLSIREDLHLRWATLLDQTCTHIERAPLRYAPRGPSAARRAHFFLSAQQYLIDYVVEDAEVVILRVWHGRQDRPW